MFLSLESAQIVATKGGLTCALLGACGLANACVIKSIPIIKGNARLNSKPPTHQSDLKKCTASNATIKKFTKL